ncbi:hypothetical protein HDV03_004343 [Kappamyces sp. JEL0829]|nr:hypothetical protein HDV03_004343 [Kappamyces sp. JEL0829]
MCLGAEIFGREGSGQAGSVIFHSNLSTSRPPLIPKIIHQTWKDSNIPAKWADAQQECRARYSDWEYRLWTDESSREFISDHYPDFLDRYDGYAYPIQRADAIRYFLLYHYGGIYMDLDVGCSRLSLENLLSYPVVIPKTKPVGYSNDVLCAEPRHPFFAQLIKQLPAWDLNFIFPYLTVFFSTGPMFLNIQYSAYQQGDVYILDPYLYSEGPEKIFKHLPGSTWHAWDAGLVKWTWGCLSLPNVGLIIFFASVFLLRKSQKQLWLARSKIY